VSSMSSAEVARLLRVNGWAVIPDVIPMPEVAPFRQAVLREAARQGDEWRAMLAAAAAAGHPRGGTGIACAENVIGTVPDIAPYLADPRIVEAIEEILGPDVRVSSTSAIVTSPGNECGGWHADWPFNQRIATHLRAPYPDVAVHFSSLFMLTEFRAETGATLIVPGSHRFASNPSADIGVDPRAPYPTETHVTGPAGSVFLYDSRLWHCAAANRSAAERVAVACRYAPWWLNLEVRRRGSPDHTAMVVERGGRDNSVPLLSAETFAALPPGARRLFRHWAETS
jgi:ectoine hydroxylase-related dioxygenase (phytanoyl-CoA dioxygenase family)